MLLLTAVIALVGPEIISRMHSYLILYRQGCSCSSTTPKVLACKRTVRQLAFLNWTLWRSRRDFTRVLQVCLRRLWAVRQELKNALFRTAAVQGATYILGRKIEAMTHVPEVPAAPAAETESGDAPKGSHFSIRLDGFANPVTADVVVSNPAYSGYLNSGTSLESNSTTDRAHYLIRGIAVLDSPIKLGSSGANTTMTQDEAGSSAGSETNASEETPGTCLVVFPPVTFEGKAIEPVSALVMGEVSLSCPADRCKLQVLKMFPCY